mmetsp:Transcript_1680/g.2723  ORF Transcript_1680/g.2723 Transcript_1680/m.2723 type:complete len:80 (-) Transcript_1680:43-282(-)
MHKESSALPGALIAYAAEYRWLLLVQKEHKDNKSMIKEKVLSSLDWLVRVCFLASLQHTRSCQSLCPCSSGTKWMHGTA